MKKRFLLFIVLNLMIEANANSLSHALHEIYKHIQGTLLETQGIIEKFN